MNTYKRHRFSPQILSNPGQYPQLFQLAFMKPPRNSRADNLPNLVPKGEYPGVEILEIPDEPDVLDAGDMVEGLGVSGLRRVRRLRRVARGSLNEAAGTENPECSFAVYNLFNLGRHLVRANHYRDLRKIAFSEWSRVVA